MVALVPRRGLLRRGWTTGQRGAGVPRKAIRGGDALRWQ